MTPYDHPLRNGDVERFTDNSETYRQVFQPTPAEVGCTIVALLVYGFGSAYGGGMLDFANILGPLLFSGGIAWGCATLVQRSVNCLWSPLLWYRVAMVSYYGFGALVPLFANDSTRELMDTFYSYFPYDLVKINAIYASFHLAIILFSTIILNLAGHQLSPNRFGFVHKSNFSLVTLGTMFLVVGLATNLLIVLPVSFRLYTVPAYGTLYNLSLTSLLGYFMLTLWSVENRPALLPVIIGLAIFESILGMILMTKFVALFPMVMVGLAFIFSRPNLFRLITYAIIMSALFSTVTPLVGFARNMNQRYYNGQADLWEVVDIYGSYGKVNIIDERYSDVQDGWMRLSYVNAGAYAINQYDRGIPGNTYRYLPIVLIPRIIFPSKPNITDISREFTFEVNGNYDSSTNPGLPAEGYYNYGWLGVAIAALLAGIVLTVWSVYSLLVLERQAWHLFFVVLAGMRVASRVDGALVSDIVGPLGIAILAHIALEFLNRFLPAQLARWHLVRPRRT